MTGRVKKRLGIQSVEVASRILQALATASRPIPLKDLAKLAHMHPGKAHRYLVSLTRTELVLQDESTGHYGLGAATIALGLAAQRNVDVVRTATALLPALRDEINETVLFSMWSPHGPVVYELEESSRPVFMNVRVGSMLPLLRTAAGHLFASFLPRDMTAELIRQERKANRASMSPKKIEALFDETRRRGLARVTGALVPGVNAIAAPIFDHKHNIVGVIGALGRSEELAVDYDAHVARALLRVSSEISRRMGRANEGAERTTQRHTRKLQ